MSGVILALLERPDGALPTLTAARSLANLMGNARINVLATRLPPETTILPTEEILTKRQALDIRQREQDRVGALRTVFDQWVVTARDPEIVIEWTDIEGVADSVVGEWGRRSDFIVLNRLTQRDRIPDRLVIQAALFDTDRPVLVVPPQPVAVIGRRVAIAWRNDKRTVRAVLAALRLLSRAEQVHVLAGVPEGGSPPLLPEVLSEHGIKAELHLLPVGAGVFGQALLTHAHEVGADMLVMGAYTHSVWREMILGGVTRYMLDHTDLPIFMRH
jgi:nucleotide-binding universal stress UspA family protein